MTEISYQLYSSRNFPDLKRQAAMLAKLGLTCVEPFGGQFADAGALKAVLDENGLSAPTAHIGAPAWRTQFDEMVPKLKTLGVGVAILPAPPPDERQGDRAHWTRLGEELRGYAKRLADHGLRFGWHNHAFEFAPLPDGSLPLDWLLGEQPDLLLQLDIAWSVRGGADPLALMRRYRDRIVSFHVKDLAPAGENVDEDGWADAGHGTLDWASLVPAMRDTPAEVWVLEHDNPSDDARFASRAFATVRSW